MESDELKLGSIQDEDDFLAATISPVSTAFHFFPDCTKSGWFVTQKIDNQFNLRYLKIRLNAACINLIQETEVQFNPNLWEFETIFEKKYYDLVRLECNQLIPMSS